MRNWERAAGIVAVLADAEPTGSASLTALEISTRAGWGSRRAAAVRAVVAELEDAGLVESDWRPTPPLSRGARCYRLTDDGHRTDTVLAVVLKLRMDASLATREIVAALSLARGVPGDGWLSRARIATSFGGGWFRYTRALRRLERAGLIEHRRVNATGAWRDEYRLKP